MREISVELVKKTVEELCVKANLYLPDGMKEKINSCIGCEKSPLSKQVLGDIVRNIDCAKELRDFSYKHSDNPFRLHPDSARSL